MGKKLGPVAPHAMRSIAQVSYDREPTRDGATQGTMVTTQPWPRGYGPDRLREVKGALEEHTDVTTPSSPVGNTARQQTGQIYNYEAGDRLTAKIKEQHPEYSDYSARTLSVSVLEGKRNSAEHQLGNRRTFEALARSSMPIRDIEAARPSKITTEEPLYSPTYLGQFDSSNREIRLVPGNRVGNTYDETVVHEMGHATHSRLNRTQFENEGKDREYGASPALEGVAEGYAARHVYHDPRSLSPGWRRAEAGRAYEGSWTGDREDKYRDTRAMVREGTPLSSVPSFHDRQVDRVNRRGAAVAMGVSRRETFEQGGMIDDVYHEGEGRVVGHVPGYDAHPGGIDAYISDAETTMQQLSKRHGGVPWAEMYPRPVTKKTEG